MWKGDNNFEKKQIKGQKKNSLKLLSKMQEAKDMDLIAELFLEVINLNGLKMDETAALLYYIQQQTVNANHNARFIKDKLGFDTNSLSVEGVLQLQRALVNTYLSNITEYYRK